MPSARCCEKHERRSHTEAVAPRASDRCIADQDVMSCRFLHRAGHNVPDCNDRPASYKAGRSSFQGLAPPERSLLAPSARCTFSERSRGVPTVEGRGVSPGPTPLPRRREGPAAVGARPGRIVRLRRRSASGSHASLDLLLGGLFPLVPSHRRLPLACVAALVDAAQSAAHRVGGACRHRTAFVRSHRKPRWS